MCLTQSCFPEASQIAKDRRSVLQFAPVENVVGASLGMPQRMTRGRSGRALAGMDENHLEKSLCTVPRPVQALGKGRCALAVQLPCLVHDLGKIVLLHTVL